jgi:tRNA dimethylallyltransferase
VEPGTYFSVNDYIHKCYEAIEDCLSRGKLPVICGGTGQYISALRDGVRFVDEPVPDALIAELEEEYDRKGAEHLYSRLVSLDPDAASGMHMNNKRRVVRALAVCIATGKTFTEWNSTSKTTGPMYPFVLFEPDYEACRDVLYDRINRRVDEMIDEGIIEEARYLYSLDIDRKSTCFQAIGYKEFEAYLSDPSEENLKEAVYKIKLNSRHYAKRQLTWFRYIDGIVKLDIGSDIDTIINCTIMPNLQ